MSKPSFTVSSSRLQALLAYWKLAVERGDVTAKQCSGWACVFGEKSSSTPENQRGQAILQYLLDTKEPVCNTAVIIGEAQTLFIHSDAIHLVGPATKVEGHVVEIHCGVEAAKGSLIAAVSAKPIGAPVNEFSIQEGSFATAFVELIRSAVPADALISAAPFLGELLFTKDETALNCIEKAAGLCCAVFRRYAKDNIATEMSRAHPKTLYDVRQQLYARLENPNTIHGLDSLVATDFSMVTGLPPCIFHKGTYISQLNVDEDTIHNTCSTPMRGDTVVVRYGIKNTGYTSFFGRTLLVESAAPPNAKEAYQCLLAISSKVMECLTPGAKLSDIYETVMSYSTSQYPQFAAFLAKSFGFSTGLLVLEARGTISEKGSAIVANGMAFVTRVVLENIESGNGESTYDMELADTVIIRNGVAELKTKVARQLTDILFEDLPEDDGEEEVVSVKRDLGAITRQGKSDTIIVSREAQRDEQLRKLLRELHEEFLASGGKKGTQTSTEEFRAYDIGRLSFGELNPFAANEQAPPSEGKGRIVVQADKKVAWFPICGHAVPFHISTINKVDVKSEGTRYTMTIAFHSMQEANVGYKLNRTKVFVKELTYSSSRDIFTDAQIAIQSVQQRIKNEDAARKRALTSASTGKLSIIPSPLRLLSVKIRPPITSSTRQNKGCVGNLELHANGLRFSFLGGVPVDLLFENIKHVIFQPAVNSICVIYHVTLKKPIDVNRKSVSEIQFVAEVMESSELASGARRSYEEEIAAEERDAVRVRETNKQFITFARAVEERSKILTQLPTNNFSFDGVHTRSMTTFKGSRDVLWAVSDWPAFTQSVEEVEVVSFERVIPGTATFDMSLILKDYNKPVITINSIPRNSLEALKDWCLSARLYYMETTVNPNWRVTMKDIRDDPEWDPWLLGDGWSVLNNETNDEEDEEEDNSGSDSDSTYYEDDDEEDESDDSSWLEDEESDVESDSDASDDSSAVSWDEMERRASKKDRHQHFSDDDDDKPRKRQRTGAATPSAPGQRPMKSVQNLPNRSAAPPARRF